MPNELHDKDKHLGIELFKVAQDFKESLLADLTGVSKNKGVLSFYEEKENEYWIKSHDYHNATKAK